MKIMSTVRTHQSVLARSVCLFCVLVLPCRSGFAEQPKDAQGLLGAKAVLKALADFIASEKNTGGTEKVNDASIQREAFRQELEAYSAHKKSLPPADAARQWLQLYHRFRDLAPVDQMTAIKEMVEQSQGGKPAQPLSLQSVLAAIPGPLAWPALAQLVEDPGRPGQLYSDQDLSLRFIIHFLNSDFSQCTSVLDEFEAGLAARGEYDRRRLQELITQTRLFLKVTTFGVPAVMIEQYKDMLKQGAGASLRDQRIRQIQIPDLLQFVPAEEAEELVLKTLKQFNTAITVPSGGDTLLLTKRVLLENIADVPYPHWELVTGLDDVELFEAIRSKFASTQEEPAQDALNVFAKDEWDWMRVDIKDDSPFLKAESVYLIGLVARDQVEKAFAYASRLSADYVSNLNLNIGWRNIDQTGFATNLFEFCGQLLNKYPATSLWKEYVMFARAAGQTDLAIDRIQTVLQQADLSVPHQILIREQLAAAYLSQDHIDQALEVYRTIVELDTRDENIVYQCSFQDKRSEIGNTFIGLGRLLKNDALVQEGLNLIADARKKNDELEQEESYYSRYDHTLELLLQLGRYGEAEQKILTKMKERLLKLNSELNLFQLEEDAALQECLMDLVQLYGRTGRAQDAIYLIEHALWWGATDLAAMDDAEFYLVVAKVLYDVGRKPEAVAILKAAIQKDPNGDAGYELLIKMEGAQAVPWLDELYARDRFEERPLIWKAAALWQADQLDEALKTIELALKVDPTDGEQTAGERVRAYGVLADILEKQGKTEDAQFFQNVLQSVRVAEEGDELTSMGLLSRSVARYEEAEKLFVDAYCIQWRLGERLHALGQFDEAQKHYEIAFRRMPEQFGQVASFCFGCESVFENKHSRSTAERVLLELKETMPDKPQVYFLLGQLREEQRQFAQAYQQYEKALALDPDYLDALEKVFDMRNQVFLPREKINDIILHMLEMDPLERHASIEISEVTDMASLWARLEENQKYNIKPPEKLLAFTAAQKRLREKYEKNEDLSRLIPFQLLQYGYQHFLPERTPAHVILQHRALEAFVQLLDADRNELFY